MSIATDYSNSNGLLFWPSSPRTRTPKNVDSGHLIGRIINERITCVSALAPFLDKDTATRDKLHKLYHVDIVGEWKLVAGVSETSMEQDGRDIHVGLNSSTCRIQLPQHMLHRVSVIYYQQPNSRALQYLSLQPLTLDPQIRQHASPASTRQRDLNRRSTRMFEDRQELFIDDHLDGVLAEINASLDVERHLVDMGLNEWYPYQRIVENLSKVGSWIGSRLHPLHMLLVYPISGLVLMVYMILEACTLLLNTRVLGMKSWRDVSVTGQQIDLRIRQLVYWPWQYLLWRRKDRESKLKPEGQAQYIGFYNTVWLVANDVIVGIGLGAFVIANADFLSETFIKCLQIYGIETIKSMVVWLMSWPGGLKLNSKLAKFLGELFLWLIDFWSGSLQPLEAYLPTYIRYAGLSGTLGASFIVSLAADLLNVTTLHLYLFYLVAAKLHSWQVSAIMSLFNLFRGQRQNPLRKRVDAAEYDLDQLLLGTILFTVLIFLFPTVAVYYMLFYISRMAVISLHGFCDIALAIINHFPLFAIMLRFKDPGRLPAGIRFRITSALDGLILENVPIGLNTIFYQYWHLLTLLQIRVFSWDIIRSSLLGLHIQRLPALQYPSPPRMTRSATFGDIHQFLASL
ncbi:hypothetical protein SmJEL517_g01907 [Synchytrium microbalum]|uniref:Phosphatidylinositol N-acetylglucosaminyltransferase n=1 Tax=Synchytrium microbalum TaxID=1806994 RepID=A0A507C8M0_9FUNG|nr:uncharacterized protein SmJEL517_g01907 [Synchytrium microbalum]TPX35678.1 hypothetical protein SmJEL517_g01907 [Synchytrium microbalum]